MAAHLHQVWAVRKLQSRIYLKQKYGLLALSGKAYQMGIFQIRVIWDGIPRTLSNAYARLRNNLFKGVARLKVQFKVPKKHREKDISFTLF